MTGSVIVGKADPGVKVWGPPPAILKWMLSAPAKAFASSMAARSVQLPPPSLHTPSPALLSPASPMASTVKVAAVSGDRNGPDAKSRPSRTKRPILTSSCPELHLVRSLIISCGPGRGMCLSASHTIVKNGPEIVIRINFYARLRGKLTRVGLDLLSGRPSVRSPTNPRLSAAASVSGWKTSVRRRIAPGTPHWPPVGPRRPGRPTSPGGTRDSIHPCPNAESPAQED